MSIGPSVLVGDRQDSIRVRKILFVFDFLVAAFLCRTCAGRVQDVLQGVPDFGTFCFFQAFRLIMRIVRRGRGTRTACRTLQFDQG